MRHQRSRFNIGPVVMAAFIGLIAACNGGVTDLGSMKDLLSSTSGPPAPLTLVVELPDQVARGQAVPMKMVLRNTGDVPIDVVVASSSGYDFWVAGPNGNLVRNRLGEVVAPLGPGSATLRPDDTLEFEWTWDQRDRDGEPVRSGTYQVVGMLDVDAGPDARSEPASVTIR